MRNWLWWVPPGVLAVGCLLVGGIRVQHEADLAAPLATLPASIAGMGSEDREISEEEQRVAGMSAYLFRIFDKGTTTPFSLYVGFYPSQTTGKTIHSPRNCLPGAGWEILHGRRESIDVGGVPVMVNRFVLAKTSKKSSEQMLVYYWYQGRGRVAANEYSVKLDLLRDAALHGRTEEALVRIMVPVRARTLNEVASAEAAAERIALEAAQRLIPEVHRVLPTWGAEAANATVRTATAGGA